jgi:hypothetical protein
MAGKKYYLWPWRLVHYSTATLWHHSLVTCKNNCHSLWPLVHHFFVVVLHNSSEVSENRLPLVQKTSALFLSDAKAQFLRHCSCTILSLQYCTTPQKCLRKIYFWPRKLVHYSTVMLWHHYLFTRRKNCLSPWHWCTIFCGGIALFLRNGWEQTCHQNHSPFHNVIITPLLHCCVVKFVPGQPARILHITHFVRHLIDIT